MISGQAPECNFAQAKGAPPWERGWQICIAQGDGDRGSEGHADKINPGSAVENTMRENFWPASIPHSAEARGREASSTDQLMTGEEAELGRTARPVAGPAGPEYRPYLQLVL